jgi:hypothetical protein
LGAAATKATSIVPSVAPADHRSHQAILQDGLVVVVWVPSAA